MPGMRRGRHHGRARAGERLAPMAELAALGVRIFTDDGSGVQDAGVMRRAMDYASGLGVTVAQHCEDSALAAGGHMHEGAWSSRLGIQGVPAEAEQVMAFRDIALSRLTGARLHLLHVSAAETLRAAAAAKAEGLQVTLEVTPHHLALTDAALQGYDPLFKVNPPLRPACDVSALRDGCALGDGGRHRERPRATSLGGEGPAVPRLLPACSVSRRHSRYRDGVSPARQPAPRRP